MSTWTAEKTLQRALEAGISCGLQTFSECVQFMYSHYDVFFLIPEYSKQNSAFILYCYSLGLVTLDPKTKKYRPIDISATEALALLTEQEQTSAFKFKRQHMTPRQRTQATKVAEALQLNPTEVNLNKIVQEMNLKASISEKFQPWVKTRWAEPSTRRGLVLLLTALTSRYLPPDLSPAILEIGLATVGLQAMVTKG